jgi:hypothetical protein
MENILSVLFNIIGVFIVWLIVVLPLISFVKFGSVETHNEDDS